MHLLCCDENRIFSDVSVLVKGFLLNVVHWVNHTQGIKHRLHVLHVNFMFAGRETTAQHPYQPAAVHACQTTLFPLF